MVSFDLNDLEGKEAHANLLAAVGPRPIAFASTVDEDGRPNLSPYSYFNVFSTRPPVLIFSPNRRVRDNTVKDTLVNAEATGEVVINVVNYALVQQMSLSSTEYPTGVNEFEKAGLTPLPSDLVKPFRVKESPVQFECKVMNINKLGEQGGAGNLIMCEILKVHADESVLNDQGIIDTTKLDLVARMGANWYCRASGDALFEVEKPIMSLGIGVDQIPPRIRQSIFLDGNDLGKLGNVERMPSNEELEEFAKHPRITEILNNSSDGMEAREKLHEYAKELLDKDKVNKAWKALLIDKLNRI